MFRIGFGVLVALVLSMSAASAQIIPPPPPPPPPGGGAPANTANHGGSRFHFGTAAWVNLGAGLAGNAILYLGHAKTHHYVLWNVGSAVLGPVGGAGALALFSPDQGLIYKLMRPGGLQCQESDRGLVAGCDWWLDHHGAKKVRYARHGKRHMAHHRHRPYLRRKAA